MVCLVWGRCLSPWRHTLVRDVRRQLERGVDVHGHLTGRRPRPKRQAEDASGGTELTKLAAALGTPAPACLGADVRAQKLARRGRGYCAGSWRVGRVSRSVARREHDEAEPDEVGPRRIAPQLCSRPLARLAHCMPARRRRRRRRRARACRRVRVVAWLHEAVQQGVAAVHEHLSHRGRGRRRHGTSHHAVTAAMSKVTAAMSKVTLWAVSRGRHVAHSVAPPRAPTNCHPHTSSEVCACVTHNTAHVYV